MPRIQGAEALMALAFETVYGTAPASGFLQMPFATSGLGAEQPLIASELLGYGRDPLDPTKDAITVDGDVVVPIDAQSFGVWLKGAFGDPTPSGTGPYTHVYTSGNWDLPSMSIELGLAKVPYFPMFTGVKVQQLSWTMQRSGLLTASVGLMGQKETPNTVTGAGTPTPFTLQRFGHFNGAISRDASPLGNVVSAQITYQNNLDMIEVIRSDGAIGGLDASMATMSGQLVVRFDSQALLTQAINGTSCALSFAYTLAGGQSLTVAVPRVFLPKPRIEVSGPQGVQATFDWQASQQANGDPMCTVTLVNGVADY